MKYNLIIRTSPVDLENDVNKAIQEGWKPQGGVSMTVVYNPTGGGYALNQFAQAIVKEIKND